MRLVLFFFTFIANTSFLLSQKHIAFDGSTFQKGDSITIGIQSRKNSYKHIWRFNAKSEKSYSPVEYSLFNKRYLIKKIYINNDKYKDAFYNKDAVVIEFGTKGILGQSMYCDIDEAIKAEEIILNSYTNNTNNVRLDEKLAFCFYVKSNNVTLSNKREEFLFRFVNSKYEKNKNDEFEYDNALGIAKSEMEDAINKIDFKTEYSLYTVLNLGKYDFNKIGFPIENSKLDIVVVNSVNQVLKGSKKDYKKIVTRFINYDKCRFINVPKNEAGSLIKRKKNKAGEIDRRVYAKINFDVVENTQGLRRSNDYDTLFCRIISIELFEYKNLKYNYIGEIKP